MSALGSFEIVMACHSRTHLVFHNLFHNLLIK